MVQIHGERAGWQVINTQDAPLLQRLVLASASPRRRDLLLQLQPNLQLDVRPANLDESQLALETSEALVQRLALAKAHWVLERLPQALAKIPVLAADTEVVLDGQALGKPKDQEDAFNLLTRLSGRSHQVKTALVVVQGHTWLSELVTTQVHFRQLNPQEIMAYIATKEPEDKAGGYAIQGRGAALVEGIEGSYSNIVGLPLEKLTQLLLTLGYRVF